MERQFGASVYVQLDLEQIPRRLADDLGLAVGSLVDQQLLVK